MGYKGLSFNSTTLPDDSEYSYLLDSTYRLGNSRASTSTADRAAGDYRASQGWQGKRWRIVVEPAGQALTVYLDYLSADDTWLQDVEGAATGNAAADVATAFDFEPQAPDFRVRLLAAATNPTALNVTVMATDDLEG